MANNIHFVWVLAMNNNTLYFKTMETKLYLKIRNKLSKEQSDFNATVEKYGSHLDDKYKDLLSNAFKQGYYSAISIVIDDSEEEPTQDEINQYFEEQKHPDQDNFMHDLINNQ